MSNNFDAVVVGAGYVGSSVAYHLCAAGLKTVLLDQGSVAAGASRANYGNIQIQDMELEKSGPFIRMARTRFSHLEDELGRKLLLREIGGLLVIENETQWKIMQSRLEALRAEGIPSELVAAKHLNEVEPSIDVSRVLGGLYHPHEGQLDPFQLIWAYLVAARRQGLEERYFHEVVGFVVQAGSVKGVKTAQGSYSAPAVILCTGAGTAALGRLLDREWDLPYTLGQAMVTEPTGVALRNHVSSASFFEQVAAGQPNDIRVGLAISQSPHGHLLLGEAMFDGPPRERHVPAASLPAIAACVVRYFPSFGKLRVLRGWSAAVAHTHDACPWLGPVPSVAGLFMATAFRSTVVITPLVGELVAQMVTHAECEVAIDDFIPERTLRHAPE